MSLDINISVDARQVKEARKEIDFLNKGLREMEDTEVSPGKDGLQETSELVRRISEDIRRMKGLTVTGERQGGLLKKEQFQEAATLSKRIGQNMADYTKEINKARNELTKLLVEKAKLERVSPTNPAQWVAAQERIEGMQDREKELRTHYERMKRNDPRVRDLRRRGGEYTETIGGFGVASGDNAGLISIKKGLAYAAAIFGGISALGLIRESWEKYKGQSVAESGLVVRGFGYQRRHSEWGYTPQEEAEAAMGLLRTTGAKDMGTLGHLERFSRLSSMDIGTATGFIGGLYNVTGIDAQKQRQAIDALLVMGKQAKDGRSEQLLGLINANLQIASRAQGGRELSSVQTSSVMAQTAALYNAPGTMGFSSNMFQTMQNALMPGGDPASEMMKWEIIGGFEGGPITASRALELERRRNAGLNDPQNLRRALAAAKRFSSTRDGQIFFMMRLLSAFGQQGGVDQATAIIDNGDRLLGARMPGTETIGTTIADLDTLYKGTEGYGVGQRSAGRELVKLDAGSGIESLMGPIESGVLTAADKTLDLVGLKKRGEDQYDPLIRDAAKKYGISPAWLKAVIKAESGFDRYAPSPKGALGLMQLMPRTGRQYGLKTTDDFFDPAKNINAGARYLSDLYRQYGGDIYQSTVSYNAGSYERGLKLFQAHKTSGGKKGTRESIDYANKVLGFMSGYKPAEEKAVREAEMGERFMRQVDILREGKEKNGLWGERLVMSKVDQIIELLAQIVQNSGGNISAGASGSLRPLPVGP